MNNKVLVTLAGRDFADQAKQVFSSAYWNAGWDGDYLLLAHGMPESELQWFRDKGIFVYECEPLSEKELAGLWHPSLVLDKFYLFTPYFKRWQRVVFLDADTIVRASLADLANAPGPIAAPNAHGTGLRQEFIKRTRRNKELFKELQGRYPLKGKAFNSGVMSFDTAIINKGTFQDLLDLYHRFGVLNKYGEEATLNLYFYRNWKLLPMIYNVYPFYTHRIYGLPYGKIQAVVFHFVREATTKPWLRTSPFHSEWTANLGKAGGIDVSAPRPPARTWTPSEERRYLRQLAVRRGLRFYRRILFAGDWLVGQIGLIIKRISPAVYDKIRIKKGEPA